MADNPYTPAFISAAVNESDYRSGLTNTANMAGGLKDIAARTGADQIDTSGIPTAGALANMQYGQDVQSRAREKQMDYKTKGMPAYASGYRQYLMWRYPTRYGSGSLTSTTTNYSPGGASIPALTLGAMPKYGKQ